MTDQISRTETGLVISSVRDKTITVVIQRTIKHPLYKKILRRSTKIQAHDQENECEDGDLVSIKECRPISKTKSWNLVSIDKKNQKINLLYDSRAKKEIRQNLVLRFILLLHFLEYYGDIHWQLAYKNSDHLEQN